MDEGSLPRPPASKLPSHHPELPRTGPGVGPPYQSVASRGSSTTSDMALETGFHPSAPGEPCRRGGGRSLLVAELGPVGVDACSGTGVLVLEEPAVGPQVRR